MYWEIDTGERARIAAEFRAQGKRAMPGDRKPVGCAMLILIPPLLIIAPKLMPGRGLAIVLVAAALAAVGVYLLLFGDQLSGAFWSGERSAGWIHWQHVSKP